ncbi:MAG TPA: hypothetical protein VGX71_05345 [Pseudaminobacter sp.]|nr:hypothetical protein [Pseudaminobacter sp.]
MDSPKAKYEPPSPKGVDIERLGDAGSKPGAKSRPAMKTGPPDDDDEFAFWRFADLKERRIVTDRVDLFRKQQRGFPKAVKFTPGQGAVALFPQRAVKEWVRANMNTVDDDNDAAA